VKILIPYYGACDAKNWKEAEEVAADLLEEMDFTDIRSLSQHDAIFPFDYVATKIRRTCGYNCGVCKNPYPGICDDHVTKGKDYLIDVTLRTRKPVRQKRLSAFRAMGYETALLILLPKKLMAVLVEIEPQDRWVTLTPSMIRKLEREWDDFFSQTKLGAA